MTSATAPSPSEVVPQAAHRAVRQAPALQGRRWAPVRSFILRLYGSGFAAAAVLCGMLLLNGCASPRGPGRPGPDAPASSPSATTATPAPGAVKIAGHAGRLSRAERDTLLQRLGGRSGSTLVQRHVEAMALYGDVDLHPASQARVLVDGPRTFAAMFDAMAQARHSILLESYIIDDSRLARRMADLLVKKRREGVSVAVIYDAVGSMKADGEYFKTLRDAGVAVCAFNPVVPKRFIPGWNLLHRDHRKLLVVDRQIAYTGGINVSGTYTSGSFGTSRRSTREADPANEPGWRDTQVELRGEAASALEDLVRQTWADQQCPESLPPLARSAAASAAANGQAPLRDPMVWVVPFTPKDEFNRIYAMMLTAIDVAVRHVYITMAYFAPGEEMIEALCDAAQRGVDVQLILPSKSDFKPVLHAGRAYYQRMLDAGVRIHEFQGSVLHAKTAVIDGVVSSVGTSNMDWRSFVGNNEVNAVVISEGFGATMVDTFQRDVKASLPIDAAVWRDRPLHERALQSLARLFERWW